MEAQGWGRVRRRVRPDGPRHEQDRPRQWDADDRVSWDESEKNVEKMGKKEKEHDGKVTVCT